MSLGNDFQLFLLCFHSGMEEECTPYARDCVTKGRQEPDGDGACFNPSTREAEAKQISVSLS